MARLRSSVGTGGINLPADVVVVQTLLKNVGVQVGRIDGICGLRTIAAIRKFQTSFLPRPDGRVDADGTTWKKLVSGSRPLPGVAVQTVPAECLASAMMPDAGTGFYRYGDAGRLNYGLPSVVNGLTDFAESWNGSHPGFPIGIGDLSALGGAGNFNRHPGSGHAGGRFVDIRPLRSDGQPLPTDINSDEYDAELTNEMVQDLLEIPGIRNILFNDTENVSGVTEYPGHDNHLHLQFKKPAGCP